MVVPELTVASQISSARTYGCRGLSLAVVEEFPPSDRYARAIFHNLAKNVKNGSEDLLTHLTQDVFIEPNTGVEERQCRYTQFADLVSEKVSGYTSFLLDLASHTQADMRHGMTVPLLRSSRR